MLVCQPPIHAVDVYAECCQHRSILRNSRITLLRTLTSTTGITVADLLDADATVAEEHRLCPYAEVYSHDNEGIIRPFISFETVLRVADDEPLLLESRAFHAEAAKARDASKPRNSRLIERYVEAKQQGEFMQASGINPGEPMA